MPELSDRVIRLCDELLEHVGESSLRDDITAVRQGLGEPLRIAVAGRVKAGKSTVVNALLGRRVAPTGVGECTKVVTIFRYGNPERLEVRPRIGPPVILSLEPDGSLPMSLGIDPIQVKDATAWISNQTLKNLTIIDTPGLSSASGAPSAATREFLAIDSASRSAVSRADALLFVLTQEPLSDEVAALRAFRSLLAGIPATPINALAVASKIDKVFEEEDDPLIASKDLCNRYRSILSSLVGGVMPLIGLLAETARAGRLTESDAANLLSLAKITHAQRIRLLISPDRFLSVKSEVTVEGRQRLLEIIDLYGVRRCLELVDAGISSASRLSEHLEQMSGMRALNETLTSTFLARTDALKAEWALAVLEKMGYREDDPATLEIRELIRDEVEAVRMLPEMHHLAAVVIMQHATSGELDLPPELLAAVQRLACEPTLAGRLSASNEASEAELKDKALQSVGIWRRFENDPGRSPLEAHAAGVVRRAYESIWNLIEKDEGDADD